MRRLQVYGMLMAKSTYTGMKLANPNKRPFVLTRAGFIGSQRFAATWTGDNLSTWEHFHMSISMVLQLGLSGQPLSGPDIGGFGSNATPKLFGRWFGVGAMFPFCRGHSEEGTTDHEPWSFGEECEEVCRLALKRRYRLIPHMYTLFYLAHTKGLPVSTPAFFADPKDPQLRTIENSFLLGPLLVYVSTVSELGVHQMQHVLPNGTWMSFDFEDSHLDLPALYLQAGSIIPFGPPHQHVGEANLNDDISLLVALDENGKAEGVLFEDDGDGYDYINGGYLLTTYIAELKSSVITVKVSKAEGLWARPNPSFFYRDPERAGEIESLKMEGDVGGGFAIERNISFSQDNPKVLNIDSSLVARNVGAGSGEFSRLFCLRIHPTFGLLHPTESYISFTSINGSKHDVWPESGEQLYEGDLRPNGEWMLVDKYLGLGLVNKFNIDQVYKCLIHWNFGIVNLELSSENRPVSKQSPLRISHRYEVMQIR
ncbi:putative alpha-glucosidase [Helianthus debilis subsp. tardiflorus]